MADIEELIERLLKPANWYYQSNTTSPINAFSNDPKLAATALSAQQREIAELREALDHPAVTSSLRFLHDHFERRRCDSDGVACCVRCNVQFLVYAVERQRAALNKQESLG